MRTALLFTALSAAWTSPAGVAQEADTGAGANLIAPITIMAWEELEFGKIAPNAAASGQVEVSPLGARACAASLECLDGGFRPAKFAVTGESDKTYSITLPTAATISNAAGDEMTVANFECPQTGGVLVDGYDDFMVGARLQVGAGQAVGRYTGIYTVTVEYD